MIIKKKSNKTIIHFNPFFVEYLFFFSVSFFFAYLGYREWKRMGTLVHFLAPGGILSIVSLIMFAIAKKFDFNIHTKKIIFDFKNKIAKVYYNKNTSAKIKKNELKQFSLKNFKVSFLPKIKNGLYVISIYFNSSAVDQELNYFNTKKLLSYLLELDKKGILTIEKKWRHIASVKPKLYHLSKLSTISVLLSLAIIILPFYFPELDIRFLPINTWVKITIFFIPQIILSLYVIFNYVFIKKPSLKKLFTTEYLDSDQSKINSKNKITKNIFTNSKLPILNIHPSKGKKSLLKYKLNALEKEIFTKMDSTVQNLPETNADIEQIYKTIIPIGKKYNLNKDESISFWIRTTFSIF